MTHFVSHREKERVADNKKQITIWGRANSVNVQKVLWCLHELDLAYERIDAGMAFGRNTEADYLGMNPNGRVPTLVDGDFVLWESNSVMRYLAMAYRPDSPIYPQSPQIRAGVDRWLDWALSTVQPVDRPVFWAMVRTPPARRDMIAIQKDVDAEAKVWKIADERLATQRYFEGDAFTLADIAIGAFARRWFGVEGVSKPKLAHLARWFAEIADRPGFQKFIAPPMT
jgi:glutathione S-transferase